jgi:hypothetical protein
MSDFIARSKKHRMPGRITASELRRIQRHARAEDRSAAGWVQRVVRDKLDELDEKEVAADE